MTRAAPGAIRDVILAYMREAGDSVSLNELSQAVHGRLGPDVPTSSIRSYMSLDKRGLFERVERGRYRLRQNELLKESPEQDARSQRYPNWRHGRSTLFTADCLDWLDAKDDNVIHGVVTDPPYGLVEYEQREQTKMRQGRGGVWRIPPSFDGHQRAPLPRFTTLTDRDRQAISRFFHRWAKKLHRVLVPGAHVMVASNPLVSHLVANAMDQGGLERRGEIIRMVMTLRGGDRPKNAHDEFDGVTVMPRSMWEPWLLFRKPIEGRVQDNLRRWKTGGLRRISATQPFGDVIKSSPTHKRERAIADHPSLKPQAFLRQLVRGILPLGEGTVLDPFAGSGSTLAACEAVGYDSIGIEADPVYARLAKRAVPSLASLEVQSKSE